MKLHSLFAHPIGEVMLDYDNQSLVSDAIKLSETIGQQVQWDCDVISSFNDKDHNNLLMSNHTNLLQQVTDAGNKFMKDVGWADDGGYVVEDFWYNLYENEHWQEAHHHGVHDLCAIYYATPDLTPTAFVNPNDYTFHQRYHRNSPHTEFTRIDYRVLPQPGKLILFPGYMYHKVPPLEQNYQQRRLTIAFNFGKDASRLKKVLDMSNKG